MKYIYTYKYIIILSTHSKWANLISQFFYTISSSKSSNIIVLCFAELMVCVYIVFYIDIEYCIPSIVLIIIPATLI